MLFPSRSHRSNILLGTGALAAVMLGLVAARAADVTDWKFDFGAGAPAPGYTSVLPATAYSDQAGYGFDFGSTVSDVDVGGAEPLRAHAVAGEQPFFFSVKVPEGNYRVTVTLGDMAEATATTVKAESRRLMLEKVGTAPGEFVTRTFVVNVRDFHLPPPPKNAPGGDQVLLDSWEKANGPAGLVLDWDDKLTLEFDPAAGGARVCLEAVEISRADELPTVFLAGDSTVTDQPREPTTSWGQMLPRFLKPVVAVANHAESGETLKSFLSELRLAKILSQMRAGDYLFIQFAHNDEKKSWPQTYVEAHTTYEAYLKVYIAEARLRGATPVLVTPMQRREWGPDGKIRNSHGDYPEAMREVAAQEHVALIDLDRMSRAFYEALGEKEAPVAFNAHGRDPTHQSAYGAYVLAKCVVQGIRDNHLPMAADIVDDFAGFDPAHPDAPAAFAVPPSPFSSEQRPRGN